MHHQSDGADMIALLGAVFSINSPNLTINHSSSNYAHRLSLKGLQTYYFEASTDTDTTPTINTNFVFEIDFVDSCQTVPMTFDANPFIPVKFDTDEA